MSSLFAEVWFWALLAFLIGALLTWVLIVRPLQQRADQQERRLQQTRRASASGGAAAGGAAGLAEPGYLRPQESDWAEEPGDPGRAAPPTQWLERDSLPPQRAGYPQDLAEEDYPLEQETRYTEDYPVEGEAGYVEEYDEDAELEEYDELGEAEAEAETELEPAEDTRGLFESAAPIEDQPSLSGFDALDTEVGTGRTPTQSLQPDAAEQTQRVEPEWPEIPTRATPPRVRPPAPAAAAEPKLEPAAKPEPAEPGFFDDEQPTTAIGPDGQLPDIEPDFDPDTGLPKRTRGASSQIRGGFEPPRPIQPSVRPIARRTPQTDTEASAGSLFEPSAGEVSSAPPGRAPGTNAAVPPGPFGPGSAMPLPGGARPGADFTVKGSVTALRYCPQDSPRFGEMVAEVWFASPADAERVGFRPLG